MCSLQRPSLDGTYLQSACTQNGKYSGLSNGESDGRLREKYIKPHHKCLIFLGWIIIAVGRPKIQNGKHIFLYFPGACLTIANLTQGIFCQANARYTCDNWEGDDYLSNVLSYLDCR